MKRVEELRGKVEKERGREEKMGKGRNRKAIRGRY